MIQTRKISETLTEIYTEDGFIRRIGTETYFRKGCVRTADIGDFEWVAEQPPYTRDEYNREVERLIAECYTTGQEIQFAREKEASGDKYIEYLAYVEDCKVKAKENLTKKTDGAVV